MTKRFYIGGLPRSGTAWAAVFMTQYPVSFCYHEGEIAGYEMPVDIEYVGNSSSGLILYDWPKYGPSIYIDRKPEDAIAALKAETEAQGWQWKKDKVAPLLDAAESAKRTATWVVKFEDLFEQEGARTLWQICLPKYADAFPVERFQQLRNLNVQVNQWRY